MRALKPPQQNQGKNALQRLRSEREKKYLHGFEVKMALETFCLNSLVSASGRECLGRILPKIKSLDDGTNTILLLQGKFFQISIFSTKAPNRTLCCSNRCG